MNCLSSCMDMDMVQSKRSKVSSCRTSAFERQEGERMKRPGMDSALHLFESVLADYTARAGVSRIGSSLQREVHGQEVVDCG